MCVILDLLWVQATLNMHTMLRIVDLQEKGKHLRDTSIVIMYASFVFWYNLFAMHATMYSVDTCKQLHNTPSSPHNQTNYLC